MERLRTITSAIFLRRSTRACFVSWVAALTGAPADVIAIDGKTS
jgi:hypothetical protein